MYIANLKLPDGKSLFDLDRKVSDILKELGARQVRNFQIGTVINELYEVTNMGAVEYMHSVSGNDISIKIIGTPSNDNRAQKSEFYGAGTFSMIGFDQSSENYTTLKARIDATLADYAVVNVYSGH